MKLLGHFVGLLIVEFLVVPATEADISLKLRQQKQQYLPPDDTSQNEEQKFEESRYGNSKYQVFEVHNHFEIPSGDPNGVSSVTSHTEEIHIEHINPPPGFPLDDPNLDATLLKVATEDNEIDQPRATIVNEVSQSSTQNSQENIPIPFPSNYRHDFPKKATPRPTEFVEIQDNYEQDASSSSQIVDSSGDYDAPLALPLVSGNTFKGPDYLPPASGEGRSVEPPPFRGPGYLPPQQASGPQSKPFKGNPYLPPVGSTNVENNSDGGPEYSASQEGVNGQQQSSGQSGTHNVFKGPDYLPPQKIVGSAQLPQTIANSNSIRPFKGPDYLPPQKSEDSAQLSQTITNSNSNQPFKGPDYLPPQKSVGSAQLSQTIANSKSNQPFKGPDYLPPQQDSFKQSGLLGNQRSSVLSGSIYSGSSVHSGLTAHSASSGHQGSSGSAGSIFQGPGYLPPQSQVAQQQNSPIASNTPFKGPDYLPPQANPSQQHHNHQSQTSQQQQAQQLQQQHDQQAQHQLHQQQDVQIQVNDAGFKAPGYLPPGYDFQKPYNADEAIAELHTLPEQEVTVNSQIQVGGVQKLSNIVYGTHKQESGPQGSSTSSYQAPGYLPPSGASGRTVHNQDLSQSIQSQQNGGGSSSAYQAPGYLPPGNGGSSGQSNQQQRTVGTGKSYSAPGYLPPRYDQQKSPEQAQGHSYQTGSHKTSGHSVLSNTQHSTGQSVFSSIHQQTSGQGVHSNIQQFSGQSALSNIQQTVGQSVQQTSDKQTTLNFHGQGQQNAVAQPFKGPGYLPPSGSSLSNSPDFHITSHQSSGGSLGSVATGHQTFQAPGYLPPSSGSALFNIAPTTAGISTFGQSNSYQAPGYLPPVGAPVSGALITHMHPLSSYMTSVQPFDRYGSARKPFPVYGPPPTPHIPAIAPMYKEPASRPQHYAPAMSYAQNAIGAQAFHTYSQQSFTASTLNQQARQALRTFMPKDIRQSLTTVPRVNSGIATTSSSGFSSSSATSSSTAIGTKVQTSAPASAKIRTVQIVNPTAVKTLKVLESLDHTGVKTIKILGTSNEEPKGDHRIVKVVSGHEQNVQTVKIFNDQQDVTTTEVAAAIAGIGGGAQATNGYLPPRRKRNPKHVSSGKGRKARTAGN
uniref:Uncharacterized protein n=1 Tax=Stomoxys calcitrans TaxID=35570 RepID=A0A1I8P4D9_STOCA